jgi:hypothetical protein
MMYRRPGDGFTMSWNLNMLALKSDPLQEGANRPA